MIARPALLPPTTRLPVPVHWNVAENSVPNVESNLLKVGARLKTVTVCPFVTLLFDPEAVKFTVWVTVPARAGRTPKPSSNAQALAIAKRCVIADCIGREYRRRACKSSKTSQILLKSRFEN